MRLFKMPAWKVGQPTLRVLALLVAPVAMSHVIGACAKRPPPGVQQEALRPGQACSNSRFTPLDEGSLTVLDGGEFEPAYLCLKPGASLEITNTCPRKSTLAFSRSNDVDGDAQTVTVGPGENASRTLKNGDLPLAEGSYSIALSEDGCAAEGAGHGPKTGNGTLEVATGGQTGGQDAGHDGKPDPRR